MDSVRSPNKNKQFSVFLLAVITITLIFPLIIFIFFNQYFDRSEEEIYKWEQKKIYLTNIKTVKQPIFSTSKNLARITIQGQAAKKNIRLSLINDRGDVLRTGVKPKIANGKIIWKFNPIKNSISQNYDLIIHTLEDNKKNVRLPLILTAHKDYYAEINDELMEGMSIVFYTESKFANPMEKILTFYDRIISYKPIFIRFLFFPTLILSFLLSIIIYRYIILNLKQGAN